MFSITPIARSFVCSAILPARSATLRAASWGVVTTEIGLGLGKMKPANATALVAAGMVSVLAFPAIGQALMGGVEPGAEEAEIEERF